MPLPFPCEGGFAWACHTQKSFPGCGFGIRPSRPTCLSPNREDDLHHGQAIGLDHSVR